MNQTRLKLRGTAAAALAAAIASSTIAACSGDDNATTPPDSGSTASSSSAAPHDSGTTDSATGDSATGDSASASDSAVSDSAAGGDSATGDAGDATARGPEPVNAIDWCGLLSVDFGSTADAADPVSVFAQYINIDPGNPDSFIPALNADCHFGGLTPIVVAGTPDGGPNSANQWYNQIEAFIVGLFDCNQPDLGALEAGTLTIRDLLPPGQADQTLTRADVNDLVATFVNAVNTEVVFQYVDNGASFGPSMLLTDAQLELLQSTLDAIAANTPNVTPSLTTYTYDACGSDSGSD